MNPLPGGVLLFCKLGDPCSAELLGEEWRDYDEIVVTISGRVYL